MEIKDILTLLKRWWWLMILLAAVGAGLGYFLTPPPDPAYAATTTILLSQGSEQELPDASTINRGQALAETYGQLMRTRPLLEEVIANLEISADPDSLAERILVQQVQSTNLMRITVTDSDPQRAADIANEIMRVFISRNQEFQSSRFETTFQELELELAEEEQALEQRTLDAYNAEADVSRTEALIEEINEQEDEGPLTAGQIAERESLQEQLAEQVVERNRAQLLLSQSRTRYDSLLSSYEEMRLYEARSTDVLSIVEEALPGRSVTPPARQRLNALQGAIAGLMLGGAIAFVIEQFRVSTVHSGEDVEELTGLPTLGVIANIKGTDPVEKLVTERQPRSATAEAYRVLRTNVEFTKGEEPLRTLVVTSSSPVEGKTTTSANLAAAMAQSGKRVILVDTDLRRPTLHKYFEQTNTRGVTTALLRMEDSSISEHVVTTGIENLYLMPSGPLPPNPADLLGSTQMAELVEELMENADLVVFDSPPSLVVADAILLSRICDATLLVVQADATRQDMLIKSQDAILGAGGNLLGVVLNRVTSSANGYYYYNSYYYTSEE